VHSGAIVCQKLALAAVKNFAGKQTGWLMFRGHAEA